MDVRKTRNNKKGIIKMEKSTQTGMCVCEATKFAFDLRQTIRFKPTELGKVIYKTHLMAYNENVPHDFAICTDDEGYLELSLFAFARVFGPFFDSNINSPVASNILLIKEEQ